MTTGNDQQGKLYLVPTPLGKTPSNNSLPPAVIETVHTLDTFLVENIQSALRFFQWIKHPIPDYKLKLYVLNKKTSAEEKNDYLDLLQKGSRVGIVSEAGCPAIADPGAEMVKMAHSRGIAVVPLVGPSSILLALMGSGMNGQSFTFHGYLPIDKNVLRSTIKRLEQDSSSKSQTQIFMETPHRNNTLLRELVNQVNTDTRICVAVSITLPDEQIITKTAGAWRESTLPDFLKKPAIFLLETGR
ncbi:MAG: SAM-dependent methyltransferase [Balneolales bacterium]